MLGLKDPLTDKLPPLTFPRVYILLPVRTLVALTLPEDITSSVAIILPTLTLPRVYKLLPLTTPLAVTLPDDNISSVAMILPTFALPRV